MLSDEEEEALDALIGAVASGNTQRCVELFNTGMSVDSQNSHGASVLMMATFYNHTELVKFLLRQKASVDLRMRFGFTALMIAAKKGHTGLIRILLHARAGKNLQAENGMSPLMFATSEGHRPVVELLLERSARVELKDKSGRSALIHACERPEPDCLALVHVLLRQKPEMTRFMHNLVDQVSFLRFCPLMQAAFKGHVQLVNMLLQRRASRNQVSCQHALLLSVVNGHSDVVRLLLKSGASVRDEDGRFWLSLPSCPAECLRQLEQPEWVEAISVRELELPRDVCLAAMRGEIATVASWLRFGGWVDARHAPFSEITLLISASMMGHVALVDMLLQRGATVDLQDSDGLSALMLAASSGRTDVVRRLLRAGAQIRLRARNSGESSNNARTALHFAQEAGSEDCIKELKDQSRRSVRLAPWLENAEARYFWGPFPRPLESAHFFYHATRWESFYDMQQMVPTPKLMAQPMGGPDGRRAEAEKYDGALCILTIPVIWFHSQSWEEIGTPYPENYVAESNLGCGEVFCEPDPPPLNSAGQMWKVQAQVLKAELESMELSQGTAPIPSQSLPELSSASAPASSPASPSSASSSHQRTGTYAYTRDVVPVLKVRVDAALGRYDYGVFLTSDRTVMKTRLIKIVIAARVVGGGPSCPATWLDGEALTRRVVHHGNAGPTCKTVASSEFFRLEFKQDGWDLKVPNLRDRRGHYCKVDVVLALPMNKPHLPLSLFEEHEVWKHKQYPSSEGGELVSDAGHSVR